MRHQLGERRRLDRRARAVGRAEASALIASWMGAAHAGFAKATRALRIAVHSRDPAAARWHATLHGALLRHMEHEETWLFPLYTGPWPPTATPEIFLDDHSLLRALLLATGETADDPESAITRCDRLWKLEGVLEHHDQREMRYLVPRLPPTAPVLDADPPFPGDRVADPRPAPWAASGGPDPVQALLCALSGAAPLSALQAEAGRLLATPVSPKVDRLAAKVAEEVEAGDRVAAWDALRLVKAARTGGIPRG